MTTPEVSTLKYANLQMAAEAIFRVGFTSGAIPKETLTLGNNRSSKFTNVLADQFLADKWTVVAHQGNTPTGFSGTLFKYGGETDPSRDLVAGELVMCFRSTEFADDNVRDSKATNELEIQASGWAFGQLADMESWYRSLQSRGLVGRPLAVTGYSLGGHLATAFNLLRQEEGRSADIAATYTFNGAGVGALKSEVRLTEVLRVFELQRRNQSGNEIVFTDPQVNGLYNQFRSSLVGAVTPTVADLDSAHGLVLANPLNGQARLLHGALLRIKAVMHEVSYLATVTNSGSGASGDPVRPSALEIDATKLDYQLAALIAGGRTESYRTSVAAAAIDGFAGRNPHVGLDPSKFFDVYGDTSPSSVSNSQYHYGAATPVFIEDQPLWRGSFLPDVAAKTAAYLDVKLLQDNFSQNDFGDTHSLVLLVDSLAVQNALAILDPSVSSSTLNAILQRASNTRKQTGGGVNNQGKAEGDTLERVIDALTKLLLNPTTTSIDTTAQMQGGSWAEIGHRNTFHNKLQTLTPALQSLAGMIQVKVSTVDLMAKARSDFSALASLIGLSPLLLTATSSQHQTALDSALRAAWEITTFEQWQTDKIMSVSDRETGAETFTQQWIDDRANLLDWMLLRNNINAQGVITPLMARGRQIAEPSNYEDKGSDLQILLSPGELALRKHIVFGGNANDSLTGYDKADHFYGGGGADNLHGNGGADYLEGNASPDALYGGADDDTLLGGTGEDTLEGGTGSDVLKGGSDTDILDGGDNDDTLYGGDGADVVQGGSGNDIQYGGRGQDSYFFDPAWGRDTIEDSDGLGSIRVTGYGTLTGTGAIKTSATTWVSADGKVNFTVVPVSGALALDITFLGGAGNPIADSIRVNNWTSGQLGLSLGGTVAPPVTDGSYVGDFAKLVQGGYYQIRDLNYINGGPVASADDVITGSDLADLVHGLNGNDALAGLAGNDALDGGDGDDFLLGGLGKDSLNGGAGRDAIFGSGYNLVTPTNPATVAPLADGAELTRGFSWVWWKNPGVDANGFETYAARGGDYGTRYDDANLIDGGAGDDWLHGATGHDTIHGGEGNDEIKGSAGQDTLFGDAGNDMIEGDGPDVLGYTSSVHAPDQADDLIVGGAGNDTLAGQGGDDELYGGDDQDKLYGDDTNPKVTPFAYHGNDHLDGGAGNDQLQGGGKDDELFGGTGDDELFGDSSINLLAGQYHGDDDLDGEDGDDYLEGGGGGDDLFGGNGADMLWGDAVVSGLTTAEQGQDHLEGEAGNDTLNGGGKADTLFGGEGDDALYGDGAVIVTAAADQGADHLDGGAGNDVLRGDARADTLMGGDGNDHLTGDNDELGAADHGDDFLDGGAGNDTLRGNGGDDFIDGGSGHDTLYGGIGNDYLAGDADNDYLEGGSGDDTLVGGAGTDLMQGGAGNDTYILTAGDSPLGPLGENEGIIDSEGENRIVFEGLGSSGTQVMVDASGTILLRVGDGQSVVVQGGVAGAIASYQFADGRILSSSELIGSYSELAGRGVDPSGRVHAAGGRNADSLQSLGGGAVVSGGRGSDTITGSGGNNTYRFSRGDGSDVLTDTGAKADQAGTATPNRIVFGAGIAASDLRLSGAAGALRLQIGADPADGITFGSFDQTRAAVVSPIDDFVFEDGTVLAYGALIARGFEGGTGDDTIAATAGNDLIAGRAGNDTVSGATGSDVYLFAAGDGQDVIDNSGNLAGDVDTLRLLGLDPTDIVLSRSGLDLVLGLRNTAEQVVVRNHFVSGSALNRIEFGSGAVWSEAHIQANLPMALTPGNDTLVGTPGNDIYAALGGNDSVRGMAGNDAIDGGVGNDILSGGDGADTLHGGEGADLLQGDAGLDRLDGGDGNDVLNGGIDDDTLLGGDGNDTLAGADGNDYAEGGAGDDTVTGEAGNDTLFGGLGNDYLDGARGANLLDGGDGSDRIFAQDGHDTLRGGEGTDTLSAGDGNNTLIDGETMSAGLGNDAFVLSSIRSIVQIDDRGGLGDVLVLPDSAMPSTTRVDVGINSGLGSVDYLDLQTLGGRILVSRYFESPAGPGTIEQIRFSDGTAWSVADVLARLPAGNLSDGDDRVTGFRWNDVVATLGGNDYVYASLGDDAVDGGSGNDTVHAGGGSDTVLGATGHDELRGEDGNDRVAGGDGNDLLFGDSDGMFGLGPADGNDSLEGGAGNDTLFGNGGDDTLNGGVGNDTLADVAGNDTFQLGRSSGRDTIVDYSGVDRIVFDADTAPADVTLFRDGNDLLIAVGTTLAQARVQQWFNASASARIERFEFAGGAFWDAATITARTVAGTPAALTGTTGNDTFIVDDAGDTIAESSNGGTDLVMSSVSYALGANVENLTLTGYADINASANALANVLTGNAGNNVLTSLGAGDTLRGGGGDDTYVVGHGATVVESAGSGMDLVIASWSFELPVHVENLTAAPLAASAQLRYGGNSLDNVITGSYRSGFWDIYDGRAGADTMIALSGFGTFYVDNPGDVIVSANADVFSSIDWTLAAGHGELTLLGGNAIAGTGNASANVLDGSSNTAANVLRGLGGDDVYRVGAGDTVVETVGQGSDTVEFNHRPADGVLRTAPYTGTSVERFRIAWDLGAGLGIVGSETAEDITYSSDASIGYSPNAAGGTVFGHGGDDRLAGGIGRDTLDGGDGNDTLSGMAGSDSLRGGRGDDLLDGGYDDDIYSFGIGDGQDAITEGADSRAGKANVLRFDAGVEPANVYVWRNGADLVLGIGGGNDQVVVRSFFAGDDPSNPTNPIQQVAFHDGTTWGLGTLRAMANPGLANTAPTVATALPDVSVAEGQSLDLFLPANAFADRDIGDALAWTATRGDGSPLVAGTYFDPVTKRLIGTFPAGVNEVRITATDYAGASASDVISITVNVEHKHIVGTAGSDHLVGLSGNDTLSGLGSPDMLDGGKGADSLLGGAGDDSYQIDDAGDRVVELAGEGTFDTITSTVSYVLPAEVERLYLSGAAVHGTGNALNNFLQGTAGSNRLDGGAGADTLYGGGGNDTYVVDNAGDLISASVGFDTVESSITWTLGADIERLVLTAAAGANVNGTGNWLANTLVGSAGANRLDGGAGADTMTGGAGDDTYVVDQAGDAIVELAGAGIDAVEASASYTLAPEVERLTLTGSSATTGTGNASANTLVGNGAANILGGAAGNDTLDGGLGNDTLDGGTGNDTYLFGRGHGADMIYALDTTVGRIDTLQLGSGVLVGDVTLQREVDDLVVIVKGSSDSVRVRNHFTGNSAGGNQIDLIRFSDGTSWNTAAIQSRLAMSRPPVLSVPIADQAVVHGGAFNLTVSSATFTDPDAGDTLTYAAAQAGGTALPSWLTFTAATRTFSGNSASASPGTTHLRVTVTDTAGLSVSDVFDLVVTPNPGGSVITGTMGNDVLSAGSLNDTIHGLAGDDGLYGGDGADVLYGQEGNDWLNGQAGIDTAVGGLGNDTYHVDVSGDVIVESPGEGFDTVYAYADHALSANIESLYLQGGATRGTGNAQDNLIYANSLSSVGFVFDGGGGADTMYGGLGNDTYHVDNPADLVSESSSAWDGTTSWTNASVDTVRASVSYTLAPNIENLMLVGASAIDGTGNLLANTITGNSAANVLSGGGGFDTLVGGAGNDTYAVSDANTQVIEAVGGGIDTVLASISWGLSDHVENLTLLAGASSGYGNASANVILGNDAGNYLSAGAGADTMIGGLGGDYYVVEDGTDVIVENAGEGIDTVQTTLAGYTLAAHLENLTLTGTAGIAGTGNAADNLMYGNSGANTLTGGAGNDTLDGLSGADTLIGGLGNDLYVVDGVADVVMESAGEGLDTVQAAVTYTLGADVENLTLTGNGSIHGTGNASANAIYGTSAANRLDGGAGADTLGGGAGDDTYLVDNSADVVSESAGLGNDTVHASASYVLGANLENLILTGASPINGTGNSMANTIAGNAGANVLDGGSGIDTMSGGAGDDTYVVDVLTDVIVESAGAGTDTVRATLSYTLGAELENLTLIGAAVAATGNALANVLTGQAGNNTLDGGAGADTMRGAAGNDIYVVDNAGDQIVENGAEGTDLVRSSVSLVLAGNVENLTLVGATALDGTGNALGNTITGNAADNVLDGGAGNDVLIGGLGNDTYRVDSTADVVTEGASGGTDSVQSSATHTLAANVENLTLTGVAAINGTGNSLANTLTGNAANNRLDGGSGGGDTMVGGLGNDTYVIDALTDGAVELAAGGIDTVQTALTYTLGAELENLVLTGIGSVNGTGNTLANALTGNAGNNVLDGRAGADTLVGGAGNDTYVVDAAADVVTEASSAGLDVVQSAVTYTLTSNVENLILTGTAATNATGNSLANALTGNVGDNVINGGTGIDTMAGGLGNDTYLVDNAADTIIEASSAGIDTVQATLNWTLATNIEKLVLTGVASINGTGNALANTITGNAGANRLDGGTGADSLAGGAGNDTYVVDNALDTITELGGGGSDTVESSIAWVLGAELERLTLTGTASLNGTGNALANTLVGNAGNNRLDGAAGSDTMTGGAGNDTYAVDAAGDSVVEVAGGGIDKVESGLGWTLGSEIENLLLTGSASIHGTGNALANVLTGNAGNNVLNGGLGNDSMAGGLGDDTFVVDVAGDVVTESASSGTDTVQAAITYSLSANVENLTLTGSAAIDGTGNVLANVMTGNGAANVLSGGAGADTLIGGLGNDVYIVDSALDIVTEAASAGTDVVHSGVTYSLGAHVENLTLTGTTAINGTGSAVANTLVGNSAANALSGGAGSDTLDGGGGADTLAGGTGNDIFVLGRGHGADLIQENDATVGNYDVLTFGTGISEEQLWFRQMANDLEVSIIGTADKALVQNWYLGSQYRVEEFRIADGQRLLDSQVQNLVSAMAGFAPPAAGQTTLPTSYRTVLAPVIAADWT